MLHPVGLYTSRGTTDPTVDLSDGFVKALDGDVPDDYYRAQDQPTASDPLVARIGTNGSSTSWPAYNATGISGQPSLDFDSTDHLLLNHLVAAQSADPNAPYGVVMPFRRTVSSTGFIFAMGRPTDNNGRFGWGLLGTGEVFFATVTTGGAVEDNVVGTPTVPLDTDGILALTYRGTSGFEARMRIGTTDTVLLFAGSGVALSPANYDFQNCHLGNSARSSNSPFPGRLGGALIRRAAWDSSDLTSYMAHYDTLYPV